MIHWKKLALGLVMAGAAAPANLPLRADDTPPSNDTPAPKAADSDDDAQPGEQEQPKPNVGGHIIIVTPDGKRQRIELPPQQMPRMGQRGPNPWLNFLAPPGGPEQPATPPKYVIGVGVVEVSPVVWAQLKREAQAGVAVAKVMENTPAAAAGLQENDIILKANDKPVAHQKVLTDVVQEAADKPVTLLVLRGGEELTMEVTPRENDVASREAQAFFRDDLPPQLLDYGVHSFGPGVVLQGDPGHVAKIEKELEQLRTQVDEINKKLDQLTNK